MTLQEAIQARHSVRAYKEQPLAQAHCRALQEKIDQVNRLGRLHVQLIQDEPRAFQGTLAKYGKFRGVTNYLVMAGVKADDLDDRIGYYGEQLVLLAQTLGMNTCWVGLSYSKVPGTYVLDEGEVIKAYIAIGYGETQGTTHKIKRIDQVSNVGNDTPEWFRRGVEATHGRQSAEVLLRVSGHERRPPSGVRPQRFFPDRLYPHGPGHCKVSL